MTPVMIASLLIELVKVAPEVLARISAQAIRTGEMTEAEAEAFKARMKKVFAQPHWTPETGEGKE